MKTKLTKNLKTESYQLKTTSNLTANSLQLKANKGFTLVELLVTISMFVIITGVVLVNSNTFDNTVLLHNFSYDVALTIKQAQTYGVNVKESSIASNSELFKYGYGVYFDKNHSTNFVLFNDINGNNKYNDGSVNNPDDDVSICSVSEGECIQKYSMRKGTKILGICVGTADNCDNSSANKLSILFLRPSLEAKIYAWNSEGLMSPKPSYAKIVLSSANGATSTVVVTSIGQIYVK